LIVASLSSLEGAVWYSIDPDASFEVLADRDVDVAAAIHRAWSQSRLGFAPPDPDLLRRHERNTWRIAGAKSRRQLENEWNAISVSTNGPQVLVVAWRPRRLQVRGKPAYWSVDVLEWPSDDKVGRYVLDAIARAAGKALPSE
jgi:hypothetical protein